MTCASRSRGSPAADNAFSRSPSKKPDWPATADPPIPLSWIAYSSRKCQWFLEPSEREQRCAIFEIDAMGAMDDAVENGIHQNGIAEHDVTPQYWNDCHR
jgi:hypothetical protein